MRRKVLSICSFFLCVPLGALAQNQAPSCDELHLIPAARECTAVAVIPVAGAGIRIVASANAEDQFAKSELEAAATEHGVGNAAPGAAVVSLQRATTPTAKALLARNHLTLSAVLHDEGYVIVPSASKGLTVIAETSAGLFYGAQTVKQLIRGTGKDAVLLAPTLRDWPAMAHRGLSDDWSRGPIPTKEFLEREIRTLAAYKVNLFSPYFEHAFAYDSTPLMGVPGGVFTAEEGRALVAYAAKYHIEIVPEQESFGHLHRLLTYEQYAPLAEQPRGSVLAPYPKPGEPSPLPVIAGWFSELAQVFPSQYAHIGADETDDLGHGRTHDAVAQQGLGAVYLDFLKQIHATLEPNHKRLLFWGDVAVHSPELVGTLPKDMIAIPWAYDARANFKPIIEPFTKAGLETWVAPGVANWNRIYPNNVEAMGNIRAFTRDGQALGATGQLNTTWNDDGEGIFDEEWFGVLFGAAAGWQRGESSEADFKASYGLAFHHDPTGKIDQAQQAMMDAHTVLSKAGLRDGQDDYFWADPYSEEGQRILVKLRPVVSQMRLDAERAITLVAEARLAAKKDGRKLVNQEALDALDLGARRLDFFGLIYQYADQMAALYTETQAKAIDPKRQAGIWGQLNENYWRARDVYDGYLMLRDQFQQTWLRDNRPYWLQNNLARYDRAADLWATRMARWLELRSSWGAPQPLPSAAEMGLAVK